MAKSNKYFSNGMCQSFKIPTKNFRSKVIVEVADKELNQTTNQLLTKYQSANFLIFDDDMNSGATLKLVCDALQDKLDNSDNKIKCLVNGFSLNGR